MVVTGPPHRPDLRRSHFDNEGAASVVSTIGDAAQAAAGVADSAVDALKNLF